MDLAPEGSITTSELTSFMEERKYYWSNEAQVYYYKDYNVLPVFTHTQAENLYVIEKGRDYAKTTRHKVFI